MELALYQDIASSKCLPESSEGTSNLNESNLINMNNVTEDNSNELFKLSENFDEMRCNPQHYYQITDLPLPDHDLALLSNENCNWVNLEPGSSSALMPGKSYPVSYSQYTDQDAELLIQQTNIMQPQELQESTVSSQRCTPGSFAYYNPESFEQDFKEMKEFAKQFKERRIELGFTQNNVALAIGALYGTMFSRASIYRFEKCLSFKQMSKLKPLLQEWLKTVDITRSPTLLPKPEVSFKKQKPRTTVDIHAKVALKQYFHKQPNPLPQEIITIAESLQLKKKVVKVWFYNKRYREKVLHSQLKSNILDGIPAGVQLNQECNVIPDVHSLNVSME